MSKHKVVISEVMRSAQANPSGNIHGGEIMKLMESAAYTVAMRYANRNVVTACVDELDFYRPILIGDSVVCKAEIVFVGKSSMDVIVEADLSGAGESLVTRASFTMVALDTDHKPCNVPPLDPETPEEKAAYEAGKRRYEERKARRQMHKAPV